MAKDELFLSLKSIVKANFEIFVQKMQSVQKELPDIKLKFISGLTAPPLFN